MRFMKPTAAALALVVASLSLSGTADARDRYYRHHHHDNNALAAGIFGFAAGAILSGALSQPRYYSCGPGYIYDPNYGCVAPIYGAPPPPVVYQPAISAGRGLSAGAGLLRPSGALDARVARLLQRPLPVVQ